MSIRPHLIKVLAVLAVVSQGCPGSTPDAKSPKGPSGKAPDAPGPQGMEDAFAPVPEGKAGLIFRLSEGKPEAEPYQRIPPQAGTPLSVDETNKILGMLPPISSKADDEQAFAMREASLAPPKTAKVIKDEFPPPATPDVPPPDKQKPGPLEVLRFQPQGDVPLAPMVTVTFNQPMVEVTSVEELAKHEPPVKITPRPPGRWRWIGAKTVVYDTSGERFPMATEYTVEIAAGTKSAIGGTMAKATKFSFKTPPPVMQAAYPQYGPHNLEPLLFVSFDQLIDAPAVLATIKVVADGKTYGTRLATPEEVEEDMAVSAYARQANDGRWLAFKLDAPLPKAAQVTVSIGPGTPSAEGPRTTDAAQNFNFFTYEPLAIIDQNCGWDGCRPLDAWAVSFNNNLDTSKWKRELVTITPDVPGMKIDQSGSYVGFRGRTKGRTKYKVTFSAGLTDIYGQTLGKDQTIIFDVGSARPSLYANGGEMQVLDPMANGKLSIFSVNHKKVKVKIYKVEPKDWAGYTRYMRKWYEYRQRPKLPGKKIFDEAVTIDGPTDELVETRIDLSAALSNGHGHAIVVVEPTTQPRDIWEWTVIHSWVQSTDIGLDAFVDHGDLTAWATNLSTGAPLDGVELSMSPHKLTAKSSKDGLANFKLPDSVSNDQVGMIVARRGDDSAMLPEYISWWDGYTGWRKTDTPEQLAWYIADDRGMYRPGEDVHVKGWLRRLDMGEGGDVGGLKGGADKVSYRFTDSRGNEIHKGSSAVNKAGGFDFTFKLPGTVNLGTSYIQLYAEGGSGVPYGRETYHYIQIQEFRRPEFEVTAQANEGPFFVGGHALVTVSAKYYAGGGLPGAQTYYNVYAQPAWFAPPGHDDYTFGQWIPWWGYYYDDYGGRGGYGGYYGGGTQTSQAFEARTDGSGDHTLRIDFDSLHPSRAMSVSTNASVMDVNRQAWGTSASLIVHPGSMYVGLKSERLFVNEGEPLHIDAIVADIDGKQVSGRPIAMRATREDYVYENGQYKSVQEDAQDCLVSSAAKDVRCTFTPKEGGTYKIRAVTKDMEGRKNETEITLWVAGGDMIPSREVSLEKVNLVPDKKDYKPGETAELLVMAPFKGGEALVSYRRGGIVKTERVKMKGSSATIKVPIESGYVPNLYVQVDVVGASDRLNDLGERDAKLPKRPAFASGSINLSIPPRERTLAVNIKPEAEKLEPGTETWITVDVKDAAGQPVVGGEIAIAVVDESVLALSGYRWPDPLGIFYPERGPDAADYHGRQYLVLANPEDAATNATVTEGSSSGPGGGGRGGGGSGSGYGDSGGADDAPRASPAPPPDAAKAPSKSAKNKDAEKMEEEGEGQNGQQPNQPGQQPGIQLRSNFDALAYYSAATPTDGSGRAQVKVKIPDNLTRYRITAVAVYGGTQFGKGEATITARLPMMVRPSPPRFLNFGDEFELPVVLQNQTDKAITVDVAVRSTNARLKDPLGRRVSVPANDRIEVRFPAAAMKAGIARFQVGAVSGRYTDAAEFKLPVWTPATTEAFATYGEIDKGSITQPVKTPGEVWEQFGGLEITTSSTAVASLTDAFLYLVSYPYEYPETLASRLMSIAALKDVLAAFKAEGLPPPDELIAVVGRDTEKLRQLQNWDGGWGTWRVGDPSWPYISIHAAHAMVRVKDKGFTVPDDTMARSLEYLRNIERHIPSWYPEDVRRALIAYALYVRERMGNPDHKRAIKLVNDAGADKLPLEACGWLLWTLSGDAAAATEVASLRKHINNRVDETAAYAHFTTSYTDGKYLLLHSDRRADAILLEALIKDQPKSDLIPKITKGLLAHRVRGRWYNTNESAFVLLALDRYFEVYENITPQFVARVWLGGQYAGEASFKGRTVDEHLIEVPMKWLVDLQAKTKGKSQNLIIQKEGDGRLYYRIGMRYAPKDLKLKAADYGFVVTREYEGVDDPEDVKRDADGTWRIKAGAKVRVRLSMVAPSRRYFVALVDPLPAGLEVMNPALAVTGEVPRDDNPTKGVDNRYWWYWSSYWFQHENLRDERVEAFTTLLWEGVYTYSYVARATTPGNFVVPPTKAEELYNPETFGRGASDRVIVQ